MKCSPCENATRNKIDVLIIDPGNTITRAPAPWVPPVSQPEPSPIPGPDINPEPPMFVTPWTNPINRFDVNDNGTVTDWDALELANFIFEHGEIDIGDMVKPDFFYDVNGDGRVNELDIRAVIGHLNNITNFNAQSANNVYDVVNGIKTIPQELQKWVPTVVGMIQQSTTKQADNILIPQIQVTQEFQHDDVQLQAGECIPCVFHLTLGFPMRNGVLGICGGQFKIRLRDNTGQFVDSEPIQIINSRLGKPNTYAPNSEYAAQAIAIRRAIIDANLISTKTKWPRYRDSDVSVIPATNGHQFTITIYNTPVGGYNVSTISGRQADLTNHPGYYYADTVAGYCYNETGTNPRRIIDFIGWAQNGTETPNDLLNKEINTYANNANIIFMFRKASDVNNGVYDNYIESAPIRGWELLTDLQGILNTQLSQAVFGVPNGFIITILGISNGLNLEKPLIPANIAEAKIGLSRFSIEPNNSTATWNATGDFFEVRIVPGTESPQARTALMLIDTENIGNCVIEQPVTPIVVRRCQPCKFKLSFTYDAPGNSLSGGWFNLRFISDVGSVDTPPIYIINSRLTRPVAGQPNHSPEWPEQAKRISQGIVDAFNSSPDWPEISVDDIEITYYNDFSVSIYAVPLNGIHTVTSPDGFVTTSVNGIPQGKRYMCPNLIGAHIEPWPAELPGQQESNGNGRRGVIVDFKGLLHNDITPSTLGLRYFASGQVVFQFRKRYDVNRQIYDNYVESVPINITSTTTIQLQDILNGTVSQALFGVSNAFSVRPIGVTQTVIVLNNNRFEIAIRHTMQQPVLDSDLMMEMRFINARHEYPQSMDITYESSGDCDVERYEESCKFNDLKISLQYDSLPRRPINIYSIYVKYVIRDLIDPTRKGVIAIPVSIYGWLDFSYLNNPPLYYCNNWMTTGVEYQIKTSQQFDNIMPIAGAIVNRPLSNFMTPTINLDDGTQDYDISQNLRTIEKIVPFPNQGPVQGQIMSGAPLTNYEPGNYLYRPYTVESIEVMMATATASNLTAALPYSTKQYEYQSSYRLPKQSSGLDVVMVVYAYDIDKLTDRIDDILDTLTDIDPNATFSLITFGHQENNGGPNVQVPITPLNVPGNKTAIKLIIDNIIKTYQINTYIPIIDILQAAYNILQPLPIDNRSRVIVITAQYDLDKSPGTDIYNAVVSQALNMANIEITMWGIQTRIIEQRIKPYDWINDSAKHTKGIASLQTDGQYIDPLIQSLLYYFTQTSSGNAGHKCANEENPAILNIGLEFTAPDGSNHQFQHSISDIELLQTVSTTNKSHHPIGSLYYVENGSDDITYGTLPEQITLGSVRWEGFKLMVDLPDGSGAVQCTAINSRAIKGTGLIRLPGLSILKTSGNAVGRCLTDIEIVRINMGQASTMSVYSITLINVSGGVWRIKINPFSGSNTTTFITENILWNASVEEVQAILEKLPDSAGKIDVSGTWPNYRILFSDLFAHGGIVGVNELTCTDQIIDMVIPGPYVYSPPGSSRNPNVGIDPIDQSCKYCEPIVTTTLNFHRENLLTNCAITTRSVASKFTQRPSEYVYYKFDGSGILQVDGTYEAKPGDKIIVVHNNVGRVTHLIPRITRSFASLLP